MVLSLFPAPVCLSSELLPVWCKVRAEVWSLGASSERFDIKSYCKFISCCGVLPQLNHTEAHLSRGVKVFVRAGNAGSCAYGCLNLVCVSLCVLWRGMGVWTSPQYTLAINALQQSQEVSFLKILQNIVWNLEWDACEVALAYAGDCLHSCVSVYEPCSCSTFPRCVFLLTVKPLFSCISNTDTDTLRKWIWPVLITSSLTLFTPLSPFPKQFMPVIFTLPVSQALPPFPDLTSAFLSACIQSVNCHTGSWYHRPPYLAVGEKTMMMPLWVSDWVWDYRYIWQASEMVFYRHRHL